MMDQYFGHKELYEVVLRAKTPMWFGERHIEGVDSTSYSFHYLLRPHLHSAECKQLLPEVLCSRVSTLWNREACLVKKRRIVTKASMI